MKRCVKCTDLDSDGHARSGYGSQNERSGRDTSETILTHVRPNRYFNVRTLLDFYGLCVKMSTVLKEAQRISMREVSDGIPTLKSGGAGASSAPSVSEKIDFSKVVIEPMFEEQVDFDTFSKSDFRAVKVRECIAVPKSKKLLQFTLDDGTGTDRTILSGIHEFYEPEELVGKTLIAITNLPPRAMMGIDSCGMLLSAIHKEEDVEKLHLLMVDDHIPAGAKLY